MVWTNPEDIPLNPPDENKHRAIDKQRSDDSVLNSLNNLIPRGGQKPKVVSVSLEDYLSIMAMLYRKIQGVRHRKECWDKIIEEHLSKFDKMGYIPTAKDIEKELLKKAKITCSYTLRDVRLENEFEVLIYSVRSSLSILSRLISSFFKGKSGLHSHSKIKEVLNRDNAWKVLAEIVNDACSDWIDDLTERRDIATHYVALTVTSSSIREDEKSELKRIQIKRVSIPLKMPKYVSLWWDDVPVVGWSSHSSTSITYEDGSTIEAHGIFDASGNLLVRRNMSIPSLPKLIDGKEYSDNLILKFEKYIVDVASVLESTLKSVEVS